MELVNLKRFFILAPVLVGLVACDGGGATQDPRVTGFPVAYVIRPFPLPNPDMEGEILQPDIRDPLQFYPGSDLYIRDHASAQADPRNVTSAITLGAGDVKDVEVSYDGQKLLFAMKEPDIEGRQPDEQPTWNIWEYTIATGSLRRIIEQDIFSEEGDDIAPNYLPDGRIIFSSTRQYGSKEALTNEAKPRYTSAVDQERNRQAMMLHVMNADGSDIKQITFAPAIDMDPYVRNDGRVVFTRWDRYSGGGNAVNIYSVNPDGTDLQLLFGAHSHGDGPVDSQMQFSQPREFPDGRVLTIIRPYTDTFGGGDIALIDTDRFADLEKPVRDHAGLSGSGLTSLTDGSASSTTRPAIGGRFISVYPLWDGSNRSLVSWTPCFLQQAGDAVPCTEFGLIDPNAIEAKPLYNLYLYDHVSQTKQSIFLATEDQAITDVVAAQPRAYPRYLEDSVAESTAKTGILHIRSVYDYDGSFKDKGARVAGAPVVITNPDDPITDFIQQTQPDDRQARFLRLIRPFVRPYVRPGSDDFDIPTRAFGGNRGRDSLMEIIGYAPIEPDGSVKVRVPANVPFSFQIVDKNGRRIGDDLGRDNEQRHMSWLQVRNGETLECNGCHDHSTNTPHGRRDAIKPVNKGAADVGPFPGQIDTVQTTASAGETMAETRIRHSCEDDNCLGLNPTLDIVYKDIWSVTKSADIDYLYEGVFSFTDETPDPVSRSCVSKWVSTCRSIINYVTHIDPLWSKARIGADGVTDFTCSRSTCHSPVDKDGLAQVPTQNEDRDPGFVSVSQINLDNVISFDPLDNNNRLKAYTELFNTDNKQEVVIDIGGIKSLADIPLLDELGVQLTDADGNPLFERTRRVPMRTGSARSSTFFNVFVEGNTDHYDATAVDPENWVPILSPAEMRLISEWLDIGAQYYNDPFAVPPN